MNGEDCNICHEPASRHMIVGKLVDVEVWHRVWCAFGMRPSDAFTPLTGVSESSRRPLISLPVIAWPREGDEPPIYRKRAVIGGEVSA
jgi:hypothetical protein